HHPATHGVLRLLVSLEGEVVRDLKPIVGYVHTGIEKNCEDKSYWKVIPFVERMDYLSYFSNMEAFVGCVERLLELEIPDRAKYLRVIHLELGRIHSHLVWLGTSALDLGAMSMFFYCFRARDRGLAYGDFDFKVPVGTVGDGWDRFKVRVQEMRESVRIIEQAIAGLPEGPWIADDRKYVLPPRHELSTSMEALIHHFKLVTEGYRVPPGEAYYAIESPRGELGCFVLADGSAKPARVHIRGPSFVHLQAR